MSSIAHADTAPESSPFAGRPAPPYWAVIFASRRNGQDSAGYAATAARMAELAAQQPGYLGVESARGEDGFGITVSYWQSPEHIAAWRAQAEHALARASGRARWYAHYELRIARVERAYGWDESGPGPGVEGPAP